MFRYDGEGVVLTWTSYDEGTYFTGKVVRIFESFNDAMEWLMAKGIRFNICVMTEGLCSLKAVYDEDVGRQEYVDISAGMIMKKTTEDEEP